MVAAYATILDMKKHNQDGAVNVLLVPLVLASLFLIGALTFGYWAFSSRQDYKDNVDQKVSAAVTVARREESISKDKAFAQAEKNPFKIYNGPEQYGSIAVTYPKTWSAYVDSTKNSGATVDGYFAAGAVPSITDDNSTFALRVQVLSQAYSEVLRSFTGQPGITTTPYALPKVPKVVGVKMTGQIEDDKTGTMVILPLRNTTLEIYTTAPAFNGDFNDIILPNFTFAP